MYTEDDFMTRRERVSDDFLRQILDGDGERHESPCNFNGSLVADGSSSARCRDNPHGTWGIKEYPLAMMYSPTQEWRALYDNEMGLSRGTIFKELDLPFMGTWDDSSRSACRGLCGGVKNG